MEAAGLVFIPENRMWGRRPGARAWIDEENKKLEEPTNYRADWMGPRGCAFPSCGRDPNSRTRSVAFRRHTMLFLPKPDQPSLVGATNEVAA
jgi:hypothetical protein